MKLLFVHYELEIGGIGSALYNLLYNIVSDSNIQIDLLLLKNKIDKKYTLPSEIKQLKAPLFTEVISSSYREINQKKCFYKTIIYFLLKAFTMIFGKQLITKLLFVFQKKLKNYDVAISFSNDVYSPKGITMGCNHFVLYNIKSKKKISFIHSDPEKLGFNYERCKATYQKFDYIINVSKTAKRKFDSIIPEYSFKSKVLNNSFLIENITKLSNTYSPYDSFEGVTFVSVCRVENASKRVDRIVRVCKRLMNENITNFRWYIVGDGPDKRTIDEFVQNNSLEKFVFLVGQHSNPYPYIKNADCFVICSAYESYPMVVIESLVLNTPVLATNYEAASEQIENSVQGIICENSTEGLYKEIKSILFDKNILIKIGNNLKSYSYDNNKILNSFYELINYDVKKKVKR